MLLHPQNDFYNNQINKQLKGVHLLYTTQQKLQLKNIINKIFIKSFKIIFYLLMAGKNGLEPLL